MASRDYYQGDEFLSENFLKYDSKERVTEYKTELETGYSFGYVLNYDGAGKLESVASMDYNTATPVRTALQYNFYNGQNKQFDSTYSTLLNRPVRKRAYTYDANGNRTSYEFYRYDTAAKSMELDFRITYAYDNNNRLVRSVTEGDYGTGWALQSMDSFAYTGNAAQYTWYLNADWDDVANDWLPEDLVTYALKGNNDVDYYIFYSWNGTGWDTLEKDICTYNSDNLLQSIKGYLYNGSTFNTIHYDGTDYYFEEHDPAGISGKIKDAVNISVSPNPVQHQLKLKTDTDIKGSVLIVNAAGQVVWKKEQLNLKDYVIDMTGYPAGNYILNVQDAEGLRVCREQFVKL